jgi:hypothetical protein
MEVLQLHGKNEVLVFELCSSVLPSHIAPLEGAGAKRRSRSPTRSASTGSSRGAPPPPPFAEVEPLDGGRAANGASYDEFDKVGGVG